MYRLPCTLRDQDQEIALGILLKILVAVRELLVPVLALVLGQALDHRDLQ